MSSGRFPPASGDPRHSRERSPPRGHERRSQSSYNDTPLADRVSEPTSRASESYTARGEPPKGPKALGPRGGYIPRARGGSYLGRGQGRGRGGDVRERDGRDTRDDPPFRGRGRGQDWAPRDRFDDRPRRSSPPPRERSRSPFSRDTREPRDGPSSAGSSISEFPSRGGRGGYRGRGRGGLDFSERGRGSVAEDFELHRARSRSREREWERPARDDRDGDGHRRDDGFRRDREDREERPRRDQPPYRPDSRNSGGPPRTPLTSRSTSTTSVLPPPYERHSSSFRDNRESNLDYDRRPLGHDGFAGGLSGYKDSELSSASLKRENDRLETRNSSPPPQAPPVPAFGSIPPRALQASQDTSTKPSLPKDEGPAVHPSRLGNLDPTRDAPSAPRGDAPSASRSYTLSNVPTAPKGRHSLDRDSGENLRGQNAAADRFSGRPMSSVPSGPAIKDTPTFQNEPIAYRSDSTQPSVRKAVEEQGRNGNLQPLQNARVSPSSNSPSSSRIPTGPRAERIGQSLRPPVPPSIRGPANRPPPINPRGRGSPSLTWTNPNLTLGRGAPRGPSIMNTVPTKKEYAGDEKPRRSTINFDSMDTTGDPRGSPQRRSYASVGQQSHERRPSGEYRGPQDISGEGATETSGGHPDVLMKDTLAGNVEEETDDDGPDEDADLDLDDGDYQEAAHKFERDMAVLNSRMPPSPRRNPVILSLLEELDALGSALEEKIKDGSADEAIKVESSTALGMPSPDEEDGELTRIKVEEQSTLALRPRPQTPSVHSLPFLASGPLTPASFMNESDLDDLDQREEIKRVLEEQFADQISHLEDENAKLEFEFKTSYKEWRMRVESAEDARRAQLLVDQPSPPPSEPLMAQLAPNVGRRGRLVTDLDYQKVLKESEESAAREEQLRRERENRAYEPPETFNDQKEAVIPVMLNQYQVEASIFVDNNNFTPPEEALVAFEWLPHKDDFTKEEHEAFVMEYVQSPKRFGIIARSEKLARRSIGDCVQHYYATKQTCPYKTHEATFSKSARGKKLARRRGVNSALGFGNDGNVDETQILPLTDAGRPKRAAAPLFGVAEPRDSEQPAAATTSARRGQAGIMNGEKTSAKRAKTTGQKPGRKPKAQLLAPQPGPSPGPSPQKNDAPVFRIEQKPVVQPEPLQQPTNPDLEGAQTLAGMTSQPFPIASNRPEETWPPADVAPVVHRPLPAPEAFNHQDQIETVMSHGGSEPPAAINSYWNVAETQDLRNYLAYYGTNWQAIAENIPAKTHTMVKNRFNKLVDIYRKNRDAGRENNDPDLESIAVRADEKLRRGDPMGSKPAPAPVSSKRRYDMTSRSDPRPLAPLADTADLDRGSPSLRPKASTQSIARAGVQQTQSLATLAQAEQGAAALSSQMLSQGPANPANRVDLQPRNTPGTPVVPLARLTMHQDERPRPSPQHVHEPPPERPAPVPHRGLQSHNQLMIERQRQAEVDSSLRQQGRGQQLLPDQKLHRERDPAVVAVQNIDRERQIHQFDPGPFAASSSIQLDDASRNLIMQRQEEKKQLERKQREHEQQQHQEQQQQQQHAQQLQALQMRRQASSSTDSTAGHLRHYPGAFAESQYQQSQQSGSPATSNLQMPMSPPTLTRPSSVPVSSNLHHLSAPLPPKKKSNIMNLLNDDSEDSKPSRKSSDSRSVATPPPQHRPPPMYQPERSLDQVLQRRETAEDSHPHVQTHHRGQHSQSQPQQLPMSREPSWPGSVIGRHQPLYESLPTFQSSPAPSQAPQAPAFMPTTGRHPFQNLQEHAASPPPGHHSRTSSYTSQQQQQPHKSRSSISTGAEHSLRPSPYANLTPTQPSHQHHNPPQHSQHQAQQQQQQQQESILFQQQQQQQQAAARQQDHHHRHRQSQQDDIRPRGGDSHLPKQQHQPLQSHSTLGDYRPRPPTDDRAARVASAAHLERDRALRQQDDTYRHHQQQHADSVRRAQEQEQFNLRQRQQREADEQQQQQQEIMLRRHRELEQRERERDREIQELLSLRAREEMQAGVGAGGRGRYTPFYDTQQGGGYGSAQGVSVPPPPPQSSAMNVPRGEERGGGSVLPPPPPSGVSVPPPPPPMLGQSGGGVQGRGLGGGYEERR